MAPVLIVLIVFMSVLAIVKMSFDWSRAHKARLGDGGSLRTSELKQLIREAVGEALEPVIDRLDEQDRRLTDNDRLLLDEPSSETLTEESDD